MTRVRITGPARRDIGQIYVWTEGCFGSAAARRYEALIHAAITDVAASPDRVGAKERPELGGGIRSWHLRSSRDRTSGQPVGRPRHLLFYLIKDHWVVILRVLHDSMDFERQL